MFRLQSQVPKFSSVDLKGERGSLFPLFAIKICGNCWIIPPQRDTRQDAFIPLPANFLQWGEDAAEGGGQSAW
jgi:hypothetical protein